MNSHKLLCEVCDEPIAQMRLHDLARPLLGSMFHPLGTGYTSPFPDPDMTWEWMRCPYCSSRPFIVTEEEATRAVEGTWDGPERVKTDQGFYRIQSKEFPGIPPQVQIMIHTDEELEAEWQARLKRVSQVPESSSRLKRRRTA